jgi:hypothetical protein
LKRSLMTTLPAAVPNIALATSARREGAIVTLEVVTTPSAMGRLASDELTELFRCDQGTDTPAMAGFWSELIALKGRSVRKRSRPGSAESTPGSGLSDQTGDKWR